MIKNKSLMDITTLSAFILLMILMTKLCIAHADPDAMARPTRPKVFTSVDELRKYLDLIRDYYSLTGKARYGKRSDLIQPDIDNPAYIQRRNFFTEIIDDNMNNEKELNKIIAQSSNPVIPEWLNKLKTLSIDRQGKLNGIQWI